MTDTRRAGRILAADPDLDRDAALGAAWRAAEAALPEGWTLMVGQTDECQFCSGYWATASWGGDVDGHRRIRVVSSETGRPRGEHHDPTPQAALEALTVALSESKP